MSSPMDEESIMKSLRTIVHTWPNPTRSRGIPVMNVVKALYQEDPRIKEYVKDTLQSSVLDLLKKDRDRFLVLHGSTVFPASGGKVSGGDMGGMRSFTVNEVRQHCSKTDAWIIVEGMVYDITPFVETHWGWSAAGKNSTIIAIMSSLGGDCTKDFRDVHYELSDWEKIQKQLASFKIGHLAEGEKDAEHPEGEVAFQTWDQLVESGRIPANAVADAVKKNQGYGVRR